MGGGGSQACPGTAPTDPRQAGQWTEPVVDGHERDAPLGHGAGDRVRLGLVEAAAEEAAAVQPQQRRGGRDAGLVPAHRDRTVRTVHEVASHCHVPEDPAGNCPAGTSTMRSAPSTGSSTPPDAAARSARSTATSACGTDTENVASVP